MYTSVLIEKYYRSPYDSHATVNHYSSSLHDPKTSGLTSLSNIYILCLIYYIYIHDIKLQVHPKLELLTVILLSLVVDTHFFSCWLYEFRSISGQCLL